MSKTDIERIKSLAGIKGHNNTHKSSPLNEEIEKTEINLNQKHFDQMKSIMESISSISENEPEKIDEKWANSTEYFDGESRELDQPTGEIVDTSLRRYLDAKGDHVTVDEFGSHDSKKMMEDYKNFKKENNLIEHKDYGSYVDPLVDKGFDVEVSEKDDGTLVFNVKKDGKTVKVMEPETGVYKISGEEKEYSSLDDALKSKFDNLTESNDILALKKNAGLLTEENHKNKEQTDNVVDIQQLKRNAGIG